MRIDIKAVTPNKSRFQLHLASQAAIGRLARRVRTIELMDSGRMAVIEFRGGATLNYPLIFAKEKRTEVMLAFYEENLRFPTFAKRHARTSTPR